MEQKKAPKADIDQRRTTGFLLGLVGVLAAVYVALEWNTAPLDDHFTPIDLSDIMHESELVPMSPETTAPQLEEQRQQEAGERLRVVDDNVETEQQDDEPQTEGNDDTTRQDGQDTEQDKPLTALGTDPDSELNFRIAEDLPQFPGGAVEFMKWLTQNLRYPEPARSRKVQGKVTAVFYVETDGSITGIDITGRLSPECDQEVRRVLEMMPPWQPGIQNGQPCRTKVCIPIVFKL